MFPKSKVICPDFLRPTGTSIFLFYSFPFHFLSTGETTIKSSFLSRTFANASATPNTPLWKRVLLGFNRPWSVLQILCLLRFSPWPWESSTKFCWGCWRGEKPFRSFPTHFQSSSAVADDHMAVSSRHFLDTLELGQTHFRLCVDMYQASAAKSRDCSGICCWSLLSLHRFVQGP